MKWLFKFLLFIGILFTTGTSRSTASFHTYSDINFIALDEVQHYQNDLKFTPVQPIRDSRVFQIVEDEEDTTTSRVKKTTPAITLICAFFIGGISLLLIDKKIKEGYQSADYTLSPLPRYIQLRNIRV